MSALSDAGEWLNGRAARELPIQRCDNTLPLNIIKIWLR